MRGDDVAGGRDSRVPARNGDMATPRELAESSL
jgi:hypothetical protein